MPTTIIDRIVRRLCADDRAFSTKPIQHGRQIAFQDGSVLTLYKTGKYQWQGDDCEDQAAIDNLIAAAQRAHDRRNPKTPAAEPLDSPTVRKSKKQARTSAGPDPRALKSVWRDTGWVRSR